MIRFSLIQSVTPVHDNYEMIIKCPLCRKSTSVLLTAESYNKLNEEYFIQNKKIQDVFPKWSKELREIFISGICELCQEQVFNQDVY